ncbi:hypothetical protein V2J09_009145 [Rumex salicifolius]
MPIYLHNRTITPTLQYHSSYKKLYHKDLDYGFLKTFGCLCYPFLRPYNSIVTINQPSPMLLVLLSMRHPLLLTLHHRIPKPLHLSPLLLGPLSLLLAHTIDSHILPSSPIFLTLHEYPSSDKFINTKTLTTSVSSVIEPRTFKQPLKHKHWQEAMTIEYNALMRNGTWSLVPCPINVNLVGCKWISRTKRNSDGSIECHKGHLVAQGFSKKGLSKLKSYLVTRVIRMVQLIF